MRWLQGTVAIVDTIFEIGHQETMPHETCDFTAAEVDFVGGQRNFRNFYSSIYVVIN